jgi:WD40 repeat protein
MGPLTGYDSSVDAITFSHDSRLLAFAGAPDKSVFVWDVVRKMARFPPLKGHEDAVIAVAFSPEDSLIASCSGDRTILVWDVTTGDQKHVLTTNKPKGDILSLAFSPDGTRLISASRALSLEVWDVKSWRIFRRVDAKYDVQWPVTLLAAFSPDCNQLVSANRNRDLFIWDANSGKLAVGPTRAHTKLIRHLAFSPDGTWVVSASEDCSVCLFNAETGERVSQPLRTGLPVSAAAVSPDRSEIVCATWGVLGGGVIVYKCLP